jgi:glycosyltransferase involved in cell wall biosynthesis
MVIVSAVIPTRGRPELLRRAVRSALSQTLRQIEVVVVVDGDDPSTLGMLKEWILEEERLRVVALEKSVGGSDARNRGVDAAQGKWIAFLDDDDEWLPGKLEAQLAVVERSHAPIIIGTSKMIARTPGRDYLWPRRLPAHQEQIGEYILARRTFTRGEGHIQTSTFFVLRSLMLAQPFRSGLLKHQDTEWLLRVGSLPGAEVVFAEDVLAIHHIEEERPSVSSRANWEYSLAWLRRDRHLFTPRALSAFALYQIAAEASEQGQWRAFPQLLLEALRYGRNSARGYVIFLAIWLLPRRRRRRLRDLIAATPILRSQVTSS